MSQMDSPPPRRTGAHREAGTAERHPGGHARRITVMSKTEKQNLRYVDYYCFMTLAEFTAWVQEDGDDEPHTTWSHRQ
jgi:hypothetical protein